MREIIVEIGQPKPLVGVLCEPGQSLNKHTAVILLNSGVLHRVGAGRITVKIARAICQQAGLISVRFDFPGTGDSSPRNTKNADFGTNTVDEVREVMDYLQQKRGIEQFILYGLCSGAQMSCQVGMVDDRVVGIAQINGYSYATLKSKIKWFFSYERWKRRFVRLPLKVNNLINGVHKKESSNVEVPDESSNFEVPTFAAYPDRTKVVDWLSIIISKKIQLYNVYTEWDLPYFYLNQFYDSFREVDFGDQLLLDYIPEATHLIEQPKYQERVIKDMVNWVSMFNR